MTAHLRSAIGRVIVVAALAAMLLGGFVAIGPRSHAAAATDCYALYQTFMFRGYLALANEDYGAAAAFFEAASMAAESC
jgi:hypothetical protein